ncbi:sugar nucleotide-binding protein [Pseudomonas reactans]|uniref:NAD-dependent epimerase/dehydratase family protein n=1 Tax=Pseudomonas reactans TaxID=117680 RepID=UPI0015A2FCB3|nr:NAD-dependent epimerase/dehydratase family protein [Pseudomonas reactans]NWC85303.1 sugar nucleotide-binding protein [Pseudomonas reactans]NWD31769.1 sugar nucleotide-binding protein [Pseudomonas reactans]NWF15162.1 sugar nucleotide-binding protein [Pseudomonas reactans]
MKLLITGATGYIGSQLASLARSEGHEVIGATRQPCSKAYLWCPYDLSEPVPVFPPGIQVFIHLAADTSTGAQISPDDEVRAAQMLIRSAYEAQARFIFISSQTADAAAPSVYGQTKWRIERDVLAAGGVVVRPGQVYGGPERGLFGVLTTLVRRVPFIPVFVPAPRVQPIHVDDLAASILTLVELPDIRGDLFNLGAVQPVSFHLFLKTIASDRVRAVRLPIPVPVVLLRLLVRVLGHSLSAKLGLQRIFSLIELPSMDSADSLERLGRVLRPMAYGMHRSGRGRRRQLLQEAVVLLSYLLKKAPHASLVRRYVRVLERAGKSRPAVASCLLRRWPILLTLLDNQTVLKSARGEGLAWRLQVALGIAEASPQGAQAFLGTLRQRGLIVTLLALGGTTIKEFAWMMASVLLRPFACQLFLESGNPREA